MIPIKTSEQIEAMREWWKILRAIHEEIWKELKVWISTMRLEEKAEELFLKYNAIPAFKGYRWYPFILCTSPNEVVVHWMPSEKVILKNWDVISIDCGCFHKWMYTDSCFSYFIWEVDPKVKHLSDTVKNALMKWIKQIRPWVRLGDIESMVQTILQRSWYCPIYDCTGHWVGKKLHEDPMILNYWKKWKWPILEEWMCLAIEPSATLGTQSKTYNKNKDKWTLVARDEAICVQWEHTVVVTKDWFEILT